jgi:hypothetical protein
MKIKVLISFLVLLSLSYAQEISTTFSQKNVFAGQVFDILFEMELDGNLEIKKDSVPPTVICLRSKADQKFPDSIPLEIFGQLNDTVLKIQGKWFWQRSLSAMALDTGYLILPPQKITLANQDYLSQANLLHVGLIPEQKDLELYDIEEHFSELPAKPFNFSEWLKANFIWLIVVILLVFVIIYLLNRKKNGTETEEVIPLTAEEKAIQAIQALQAEKVWQTGEMKSHFVELSGILKNYLDEVHPQNFQEKTSSEIVLLLKQLGIPGPEAERWSFLLNVSDMVKFAQSNVNQEVIESLSAQAGSLILNHRQR